MCYVGGYRDGVAGRNVFMCKWEGLGEEGVHYY